MGIFTKASAMKVKTYGNPVLRKDCQKIDKITDEIKELSKKDFNSLSYRIVIRDYQIYSKLLFFFIYC